MIRNGKVVRPITVNRGVGNSIIPLRFNNHPEIVVAELKTVI